MKKLIFFAALAALIYLFLELPNTIKLVVYAVAPLLFGLVVYLQERGQK